MTMNRANEWPELLFDFFERKRNQPFEWGKNDCAGFVIDAIETLTGETVASELRGYRSASGAARRIREKGGMESILISLGFERIEIGFAQRGDIVIADMDGREIYGIVAGNGFYCSPGEEAMLSRPMSEVTSVYRF
jgi:hypothetical protein